MKYLVFPEDDNASACAINAGVAVGSCLLHAGASACLAQACGVAEDFLIDACAAKACGVDN